ncbi:uncharacterized protein LOC127854181 [Dreissena polymorpha]|uniref:Uncharacterized protein n=1 Tax=Dreissena polymorpha TaxID=45954 RepID=A0A9D4NCC8_DREPO|nr:uncharacterized protein LOC127854181 [Dreissena polymorpha]KAH3891189.1 hypothetical protein DPMN_015278 [Dreissena polymorpha]
MVSRSKMLPVLFILICCCTICPSKSYNCGDNPMHVFKYIVQSTGKNFEYFIKNMREDKLSDYDSLKKSYDNFLDCTRATQTGYYKRSIMRPTKSPSGSLSADLLNSYIKESTMRSQMRQIKAQEASQKLRSFRDALHKMTPILMEISNKFKKNDYQLESGDNLITDPLNEFTKNNRLESRDMSLTDSLPVVIKRRVMVSNDE